MRTIRYYLYQKYPLYFRQFNQVCELEIKSETRKTARRLRKKNNIISLFRVLLLCNNFITVNIVFFILTLFEILSLLAVYSLNDKLSIAILFYVLYIIFFILFSVCTPKIKFSYYRAVNHFKGKYSLGNQQAIEILEATITEIKNKTIIINFLFKNLCLPLLSTLLFTNFIKLVVNPVSWNDFCQEIYNFIGLNFITTNSFGTILIIFLSITGILYFFRRACPIIWLETAVSTLKKMNCSSRL